MSVRLGTSGGPWRTVCFLGAAVAALLAADAAWAQMAPPGVRGPRDPLANPPPALPMLEPPLPYAAPDEAPSISAAPRHVAPSLAADAAMTAGAPSLHALNENLRRAAIAQQTATVSVYRWNAAYGPGYLVAPSPYLYVPPRALRRAYRTGVYPPLVVASWGVGPSPWFVNPSLSAAAHGAGYEPTWTNPNGSLDRSLDPLPPTSIDRGATLDVLPAEPEQLPPPPPVPGAQLEESGPREF